jgi:predicted RNase H-like HicB family nuclease
VKGWRGQGRGFGFRKAYYPLTRIRDRKWALCVRATGFVALCPELDVASEGASIEEARANLIEALTLFFETAAPSEVARRLHDDVFVTQVEVPVG